MKNYNIQTDIDKTIVRGTLKALALLGLIFFVGCFCFGIAVFWVIIK